MWLNSTLSYPTRLLSQQKIVSAQSDVRASSAAVGPDKEAPKVKVKVKTKVVAIAVAVAVAANLGREATLQETVMVTAEVAKLRLKARKIRQTITAVATLTATH
jgi:hypothetical protein